MRTQNRTTLDLGPYHTGFWYGKITGTIASAGGIYALAAGGMLTLTTPPLVMLGIFSGCIGYLAGGTVGGFVGSHMAKSITFNAYKQTVQAHSQINDNIVATQAELTNLAKETLEQVYPKAQSENREISAICGTAAGLAVAGTAAIVVNYCSSESGKKTLTKIGEKVPNLIDRLIPEPTKNANKSSPQVQPTYTQSSHDYSAYNHSAAWTTPRENNTDHSDNSNKLMGNAANNFPLLEG
jgi:hypothetical protein